MIQLYPSQEQYLAKLGNKPYMFAGVGSGKTLMALFRASRKGAKKVIVICPASVRNEKVWEKDLAKTNLQFDEFQVEGFSFLQKFQKLDFTKYSDYYVIIDEAHKIKNSQSKQGMGAFKLCMNTRIGYSLLSGTPMSKWADATNYAKITGLVRHKTEFYRRFVLEQRAFSHKGMDIVGYQHTDELVKWWSDIAERGYSEDFVELPKKQIIEAVIPIKKTAYIKMIKERITDDGEPLDSASKLTWALRAYAEQAPEKINWVLEKVEGLENCLIFVNTIAALDLVHEKLKAAHIDHGVYYGKKKDKFEDHNVMIVQYQSGGTGLNLQKFSTTIFLSPCYSFIDYTQAVGRTYRNGQENKCTFYQLKASGTIDSSIYQALNEKRDFDDKLNDVPQQSWMEMMS